MRLEKDQGLWHEGLAGKVPVHNYTLTQSAALSFVTCAGHRLPGKAEQAAQLPWAGQLAPHSYWLNISKCVFTKNTFFFFIVK